MNIWIDIMEHINKKYSIIHLIQSRAYNQNQAKLITNVVR